MKPIFETKKNNLPISINQTNKDMGFGNCRRSQRCDLESHQGPGVCALTTSNSVQLGIQPENYLAMIDAVKTDGVYPLA